MTSTGRLTVSNTGDSFWPRRGSGVLAGRQATIHWAFADLFRRTFPDVRVRPEEVLITDRDDLILTGGVTSWHGLALHLVTRFVDTTAAQALARMLMLEWHGQGQVPYLDFTPRRDHGDATVAALQVWIDRHLETAQPVEEMSARCGLTQRSLERRFRSATGYPPIAYVQQLRVHRARRLLERTTMPVEQVGFAVGYLNTAYFRKVFQRSTRLGPAAYRRKFGIHPPRGGR